MRSIRVGLVSDTHRLLRPEALQALAGSDCIVHAGDIGAPRVLEALARIAPVTAVRGNNDRGDWAASLPETASLRAGDATIVVIHELARLDLAALADQPRAVVFGHSHRPSVETRDGVLFVNPGSAGPRRFRLPVSLARMTVRGGELSVELVSLSA
jgi:putative phosphoesterase